VEVHTGTKGRSAGEVPEAHRSATAGDHTVTRHRSIGGRVYVAADVLDSGGRAGLKSHVDEAEPAEANSLSEVRLAAYDATASRISRERQCALSVRIVREHLDAAEDAAQLALRSVTRAPAFNVNSGQIHYGAA
jgi:hypothetical protein